MIVSASLHTRISVASLSLGAVTSRLARSLLRSASHQGISDQRCRANALLAMIRYRTDGVRSTSRRLLAWINALLIHTGQLSRTSRVRPTSNHTRLSLAYFSSTTVVISSTNRLASSSIASFVVQASLIVGTNRSAHVLDTRSTVRAVSVLGTLQRRGTNTADLGSRTRNHSVDARTARSMVHDRTGRVRTARTIAARIRATVVATRFASTTVVVRMTSVHASSVQADVAQEAVVVQAARQHALASDALLVERALLVSAAARQTHRLVAGHPRGAVGTGAAQHGHADALERGIAGETGWA